MVAGKVYLVKTEAPGLIPTSLPSPPAKGLVPAVAQHCCYKHPMRSSLISHHASPARVVSPGSSAPAAPVVVSPSLHFGIPQQGHQIGITVPSLCGTAVISPACFGVQLGLASL